MREFPVILSDSGTLNAGSTFTPNSDRMQNIYRQPIQIEEMRVLLSLLNPVNPQNTGLFSLGALTRVRIDVGRKQITNGYVPLGVLGPREQPAMTPWFVKFTAANNSAFYDYYKWRLPTPMPLDIGTPFLPTFQWIAPNNAIASTQGGNNNSLLVNVSLVGRSIGGGVMPKSARVPYVSAFIPTAGETQSNDRDLRNIFSDRPILVQRMCAKIFTRGFSSGAFAFNEAWHDTDSIGQLAAETLSSATPQDIDGTAGAPAPGLVFRDAIQRKFKLEDHNGNWIVKDFTSWMAAFDSIRMAWTFNREIPSDESWALTMQDPASALYVPVVSIVGSREEKFLW